MNHLSAVKTGCCLVYMDAEGGIAAEISGVHLRTTNNQ